MPRSVSLFLFLATIILNLDRRWVPKRAGCKPFWLSFLSPTALGGTWNWLQRLEMLVSGWYKLSLALAKLTFISHWRQPLLQCCKSLMKWMKYPEFSAHSSMEEHPEIENWPSSLYPFLLLLFSPGSQQLITTGRSWQPHGVQTQDSSTTRLPHSSMALTAAINVDKGWLPKGEGEKLNRKEARPETLFDGKIHQNQYSLAWFLTALPFKMKISQVIFFSQICSNLLHYVFEG